MSATDLTNYKGLFITTAKDHIHAVDSLLKRVSKKNNPDNIAQELFRHIHSLKGSSSVMGYKKIVTLCDEIDSIIHPSADTFDINPKKLEKLLTLVLSLKDEIKTIEKDP